MINLKTGGDGNFIINHTYVPKDKITFIITDEYISFQGYYPTIGSQGKRYTYSDFTLDGVVCESNAQFIDWIQANCFKKKVAFDVYFKGVADPTTEPVMEGGVMYIVLAPATLPNFLDSTGTAITVTQDDLDAGDVFLIGTDGVFDMQVDATREYVDNLDFVRLAKNSGIPNVYSSALIGTNPSNVVGLLYYGEDLSTTGRLVKRTSNNRIKAASPSEADDCVNLQFFNDNTKNKPAIQALTPIADPSTATVQDCATLLNSIVAALKA